MNVAFNLITILIYKLILTHTSFLFCKACTSVNLIHTNPFAKSMNNNSIRHVPNTLESVILSKSFSKNLDRKYIQVDGKGIGLELFLIIKSNNFVLLYDTPYEHIYYCCDTVTYGLWKFENDHKKYFIEYSSSLEYQKNRG